MAIPQYILVCLAPICCSTKAQTDKRGDTESSCDLEKSPNSVNSFRRFSNALFWLSLLSPVVFWQLVTGKDAKFDVFCAGRQWGLMEGNCDFLLVAVDVLHSSYRVKGRKDQIKFNKGWNETRTTPPPLSWNQKKSEPGGKNWNSMHMSLENHHHASLQIHGPGAYSSPV